MTNQGFELLTDAAAVRLRIRAKKLEDLFRFALKGVASFLKPEFEKMRDRSERVRHAVSVEAVDLSSVLIEFLSAAIAASDGARALFTDAKFKKFGENFIEGEFVGATVDGFDNEIKAVSYEDVDVRRDPETGMYETVLVFEV